MRDLLHSYYFNLLCHLWFSSINEGVIKAEKGFRQVFLESPKRVKIISIQFFQGAVIHRAHLLATSLVYLHMIRELIGNAQHKISVNLIAPGLFRIPNGMTLCD